MMILTTNLLHKLLLHVCAVVEVINVRRAHAQTIWRMIVES